MTTPIDNPPAFPAAQAYGPDSGMTLRDYFAAAALPRLHFESHAYGVTATDQKAVAEYVYSVADAMLEARVTKGKEDGV